MKWENLKSDNCPYCNNALILDNDEMRCNSCLFHISCVRFQAIAKHRRKPITSIQKMKWQNLRDNLCPICDASLHEIVGKRSKLFCSEATCPFRIANVRMQEILDDENHPANKYFGVILEIPLIGI